MNLTFLLAGVLLHGTPARLLHAVRVATPSVWGVILQYPFYAGIAAIITGTHLSQQLANAFVSISTPATYPMVVAVYSAVLGVFVPSGGSKWVVEAPYVMAAAHTLQVHLGWVVASYDLGEALANLVQPFWMLPVLGVLGLKARDIMGYTFVVFVVLTPVVLLLVGLLGDDAPLSAVALAGRHALLRAAQRLAEAQDVAVAIPHRELLHLIRLLHDRPVDDLGALRLQFGVQGPHVADPEEGVPGAALLLVGTDALRCGDQPEHHRQAVTTHDAEHRRCASDVVPPEAEHAARSTSRMPRHRPPGNTARSEATDPAAPTAWSPPRYDERAHLDCGPRRVTRHAATDRDAATTVNSMNHGSVARCGSTARRQMWARVSRPKTTPVAMT